MLVKLCCIIFFTNHLNHRTVNKRTYGTPSANPRQLCVAQLKSFSTGAIIFCTLNGNSLFLKSPKSKKKKLAITSFYYLGQDWVIHENLFAKTSEVSTISHTRENSKMFLITSKYFSFITFLTFSYSGKKT